MATRAAASAIAALTITAGFAASTADAQTFQRRLGDQNNEHHFSIANTDDGGWITAGYRRNFAVVGVFADADFHIVKYKPDGSIDWERAWGRGSTEDIAYSVKQSSDGGYIVAGESESTAPGLGTVILKLTPAGLLDWSRAYEGSFMADAVHARHPGVAIDEDPEGRIWLVGSFDFVPMALVTDASGAPIAQRRYFIPPEFEGQVGFTDIEFDDAEGGAVISGTARYLGHNTDGNPTGNPAGGPFGGVSLRQDAFLFRVTDELDPAGPLHLYDWLNDVSNPEFPNVWETGDGVDQLPDGSFVLAGRTAFEEGPAYRGTIMVHADPSLAPFWGLDYMTFGADGIRASVETAYAAVEFDRKADAFIQAGRVDIANDNSAHMQLTGIDGTPIWSHAYGGPFFARGESVQPHPECGYTFTGFINGPFPSEFGFGAGEIYLVKTDDRGDSGCLQQELIAEPVGPTQCEYLPVQARPLVESQTLPNFLDFTDSSEEVFCFDDLCGAPPEPTPCNAADLAAPFELLNSSDINAFVAGYLASQPNADLAAPAGVWNSSDINAFVAAYLAGCP